MPQSLCLSFQEARSFEQLQNTYHDGTRHAGQLAQSSRKTFKLARKLTVATLATLHTFWLASPGIAFAFYNPFEGSPIGSNYDATGANTTGRYFVKFVGDWSQTTDMQRTTVPNLELMEVA